MKTLPQRIENWSASLTPEVAAGDLYKRCPIAHKWKAPFRAVLVRETSLWRMSDLGTAFLHLVDHDDALAARIILRSAIETTALLAYLNKKLLAVVEERVSFPEFDEITKKLLVGGKNEGDYCAPVNVVTAVDHLAKDHPTILDIYNRLSEDVHPNASGMIYAYGETNPREYETKFTRKMSNSEVTKNHTSTSADLVFFYFEEHYNLIWPKHFERFEQWLRDNDAKLSPLGTRSQND